MKPGIILAAVAALFIIGGGVAGAWWYTQNSPASPATTETEQIDDHSHETETEDTGLDADVGVEVEVTAAKTVTVSYSSSGFSPSTITINRGDTVRFVAASGVNMWVGGGEHPTHSQYDGTTRDEHCTNGVSTSFDQCGKGSSYSFKFTKAGTWGFHNHEESDHAGTVIVK